MEDGLGDGSKIYLAQPSTVLILVLVEDGLGEVPGQDFQNKTYFVLILVLVEDGLGALPYSQKQQRTQRLNPCFSGGWSRSPIRERGKSHEPLVS